MDFKEYWKGIIASAGAVVAVVAQYTDLWCNTWWPSVIAAATAIGVVIKRNGTRPTDTSQGE